MRFGRAWWYQVVKNVQAQATSYWSGERDYQRDNQMGANVIWLADQMLATADRERGRGRVAQVQPGFNRSAAVPRASENCQRSAHHVSPPTVANTSHGRTGRLCARA